MMPGLRTDDFNMCHVETWRAASLPESRPLPQYLLSARPVILSVSEESPKRDMYTCALYDKKAAGQYPHVLPPPYGEGMEERPGEAVKGHKRP